MLVRDVMTENPKTALPTTSAGEVAEMLYDHGIRHVPIVATFRARGPEPSEAFTFKVINVHVDRDRPMGNGGGDGLW